MKKALIVGTYVNAPYHPFQQVDEALAELLAPAFDIDISDDLTRLLTMEGEGYSLCVSYVDMFDKPFPADAANAVLSFVRQGGGLLCLHNGISLQTDHRLFHLIGGKFTGHPPQTDLAFSPCPDGFLHEIAPFTLSEEPYQFEMSGDEVIPLLAYRYMDTDYPAGWCRTEGKGRVVFLTPGHSIASFRCEAYLAMIRKSAEWAAMMTDKQDFPKNRR
ncbi:MAG: ThuA domain-containing protein [Clostridia bacterium]|nr:ThuA domain-containing protein [Clostridia bacterium]